MMLASALQVLKRIKEYFLVCRCIHSFVRWLLSWYCRLFTFVFICCRFVACGRIVLARGLTLFSTPGLWPYRLPLRLHIENPGIRPSFTLPQTGCPGEHSGSSANLGKSCSSIGKSERWVWRYGRNRNRNHAQL